MNANISAAFLISRLLIGIGISMVLVSTSFAQVIAVENGNQEKAGSTPTMTLLWHGTNAKATVVYIPGGDGHLGIKPETNNLRPYFYQILKRLSDPEKSSGSFNVVVFDSPTELWGRSRDTADHLKRIESVIIFYKEKFNKPVWLMGHSAGAYSVAQFIKYLQKENKNDLIQGIILSSSSPNISFNSILNIPISFMHHSKDECKGTATFSKRQESFLTVKDRNRSITSIVQIVTGNSVPGDPCRSGYHMYEGAGEEVSKVMEDFLLKFY